jgi:hypothetical protein
VRDTVDRLIADVYLGKVQPRIAASLAPLLNLQMRAIEASDLEGRFAKLEKRLAPSPDAHAKYEVLGTGESPQVKTYERSVLVKE